MRKLSDQPLEVFEQIVSSQNFLLILVGAVIWLLGFFMGIIAPFFTVPGFALTVIATAQAVMSRPISSALPGLLLGGLIQIFWFLHNISTVRWMGSRSHDNCVRWSLATFLWVLNRTSKN